MKNILFLFVLLPLFAFGQAADMVELEKQVDSLLEKSQVYTEKGDFEEALIINDKVERLTLQLLGQESAAYGRVRLGRGQALYSCGKYEEAEQCYLEAEALIGKILGEDNAEYASILSRLGSLYRSMGKYEEAGSKLARAKDIRERVLGRETADYANSLHHLANLNYSLGNYDKAKALWEEANAIQERVLGKEHAEYAMSLKGLGIIQLIQGNYEEAKLIMLESLTIREKILGMGHPGLLPFMNNLGILYNVIGDFEKGEKLLLEALSIKKEVYGKQHESYAAGLSALGNLYMGVVNYDKAESYFQEALAIREKALGKEHPDYTLSLNRLGLLYHKIGKYKKAEVFLLESLSIREAVLGKEHPDCIQNWTNLGGVYNDLGNYEKAAFCARKSLEIVENVFGREHILYANALISLGLTNKDMGKYEEGQSLLLEASAIYEKAVGKEHPVYAMNLDNLGVLYQSQGDFEKAIPYCLESNEIQKRLLSRAIRHLSERELSEYIQRFIANYNQLSYWAQFRPELTAISYDNNLFFKGFLLNASIQVKHLAQHSPRGMDLFLQLKTQHRLLAAEYAKPAARRKKLEETLTMVNQLEKEIAQTVAGFGDVILEVSWQDVQAKLRVGEAAVEFIRYQFYNPELTDSVMYTAIVLRPGDEQPHFIPLFEQKQLQALLDDELIEQKNFLNQLYGNRNEKGQYNTALHQLIWQPIDSLLSNIQTIYASPSGLLHRLNLGAIMASDNQTFSDQYQLITLGSTRQLVVPGNTTIDSTLSATIYGGIRYKMDSTAIANAIQGQAVDFADDGQLSISYLDRNSPERGRDWDYLPGTAKEASTINAFISKREGQSKAFTGYAATEESFKSLGKESRSPRILHVATHGYFYSDPENNSSPLGRGWEGPSSFKISDHPMIRSGLVMAGGNQAWRGKPVPEGLEDGILTAYEVSQVNLRNTELVVLSACETGLGDIEGNEGVYGLQRAFKIAGADKLIMSLWAVPDGQTQEMMVLFYDHWLNKGMELREAFQAAQKAMREKYPEHYYWGAFVLIE